MESSQKRTTCNGWRLAEFQFQLSEVTESTLKASEKAAAPRL